MTWLPVLWPALSLLLLFAVVGVGTAWAIGVRGLWVAALAPAFTVTIVGLAAIVAPWVGLPWSVGPVLLLAALIGGVSFVVRIRTTPARGADKRRRGAFDVWPVAAILAAAVVISWRFVQIVGTPEAFSQTFDNVFHMNAIRWIVDTGSASSLSLGQMTSPGGSLPFYPAAWHALAALVVQLTGVSVPVAISAQTLLVSAIVWPLGAVLLTRTLFGGSAVATVAAGILSAAIPAFPFLLMDYGVLYPYQLGLAVLPVALAVTLRLLRIVDAPPTGSWWWALILVGVLPGMSLAHPGAFVAWLALSVPIFLAFLWRCYRSATTSKGRLAVVAGVVGYVAVGGLLVRVLRPPLETRQWPIPIGVGDALRQIFTVSMFYGVAAIAVAVAVAVGAVWAIIRHRTSDVIALAMYLIAAWLFFSVAALQIWDLRDAFTGSWYNNWPRVAAFLAIVMVPLGAYGVQRTAAWLGRLSASRVISRSARWARAAGAALLVVAGVALTQTAAMTEAVRSAHRLFVMNDSSPLVSADEYALLSRLDDSVPEGVMVAGNPYTGASAAYALADRPVLMTHTLVEITPVMNEIVEGLSEATAGDPVCRAVAELNLGFVLDFGDREVHGGRHEYPGLEGLADSSAVRLVDAQGDARLYEVTACDR